MKLFLRQYLFLILGGMIIALGILSTAVSFLKDSSLFDRKNVPLNAMNKVELMPGEYALFYEYDQTSKHYGPVTFTQNNKVSNIEKRIAFSVKNDGREIDLRENKTMSYKMNNSVGQSIVSFEIDRQGQYEILVETTDHNDIGPSRFTLVVDFTMRIVSLFKNLGVYLLISVPVLLIGILIYRKEKNANKAI